MEPPLHRQEQLKYIDQVRQQYSGHMHHFLLDHNDELKMSYNRHTGQLTARIGFDKGDLVCQLRGSVIETSTLRNLLLNKTLKASDLVYPLAYLDPLQKLLLSVKSMGRLMFKTSENGNCILSQHFGVKLFIRAKRDIQTGETLSLHSECAPMLFNPASFV